MKVKTATEKEIEKKSRIIEKTEKEIKIGLAEKNEIQKEIMQLIASYGLPGALERISWDRKLWNHLGIIPSKHLREHIDHINIDDDYSIQGDRIALQVIGELRKRREKIDENKASEIERRYDVATTKEAKDTQAWADEIAYG